MEVSACFSTTLRAVSVLSLTDIIQSGRVANELGHSPAQGARVHHN